MAIASAVLGFALRGGWRIAFDMNSEILHCCRNVDSVLYVYCHRLPALIAFLGTALAMLEARQPGACGLQKSNDRCWQCCAFA